VDMSILARWKIRPRLMGVPGVANVSIYGQPYLPSCREAPAPQ
jgi:Cu/Ag efflux pump CusA